MTVKGLSMSDLFLLNQIYSKGKQVGSQRRMKPQCRTPSHRSWQQKAQPLGKTTLAQKVCLPCSQYSDSYRVFTRTFGRQVSLPRPFFFCMAMDFGKTCLLGGLIWFDSLALNLHTNLVCTKCDTLSNCKIWWAFKKINH